MEAMTTKGAFARVAQPDLALASCTCSCLRPWPALELGSPQPKTTPQPGSRETPLRFVSRELGRARHAGAISGRARHGLGRAGRPGWPQPPSQTRPKRPHVGNNSSIHDHLSNLPDAVLHDILSFLKARQVVQMSVLSKRWRHLWRSVPCLDIDEREFISTTDLNGSEEYNYQCSAAGRNDRERFEDFADNLLAHRNNGSQLDTFQLQIGKGNCYKRMDATRWIRRGLKCSPKVLCYHDNYTYSGPMPNLDSGSCCLRKLHLYGVQLHDCFSEQISSVCNRLETLELKDCELCFEEITFGALKNLMVHNCSLHLSKYYKTTDELSIMAPNLSHLHVVLYVSGDKVLVNAMPSLIEAKICLKENDDEKLCCNQWLLVSNLFNAMSLELSGLQTMEMRNAEPVEFPIFKNLRTLLLDDCDMRDNFQLLVQFLQKSPNLEKLIVRSCMFSKGSSQCVNLVDPQCGKLKSTEIVYEDGDNSHVLARVCG